MFQKIIKRLALFFHKMKYYGFGIAFFDLLDSQKNKFKISYTTVNEGKHRAIIDWLYKNFSYLISEYKEKSEIISGLLDTAIPKKIWICWWDGIDAMPPIIKACYNSVLSNKNDFHINVITKYNYKDYLSLPEHIINKVNNGMITITHFSDIIRMYLLYKYGGIWLDASVLVTNPIDMNNKCFFTICGDFKGDNVAKNRWAGNCIGGISNFILFEFIYNLFSEYWKNFNDLIDYFLIDYSIALAYSFIPLVKDTIDNIREEDKFNNAKYMFLQSCLAKELDLVVFNNIIQNTVFHKLSWKEKFPVMTSDNKLTVYGYILKKYSE